MPRKKWVFEAQSQSPGALAALLEAVDNQIESGSPPEAREAFERITREGYSVSEAKKLIGACLSLEFWHVLHPEGGGYNPERYVAALNGLPGVLPEALR